MSTGYAPAEWTTMYSTIATSAVALAGLLFVALSVNLSRILQDAVHVARAREALGGLISLFFMGLLILIPAQGPVPLGWELLGLGAIIVVVSIKLQGETIRRIGHGRRRRWAFRLILFNSATITLLVSGISLISGAGGGLYWLLPTVAIYFIWSILNAWKLVVQPLGQ